jgi:formylglycine-generating enzyme required for sulfatase activity
VPANGGPREGSRAETPLSAAKPAGSFTIPAYAYDRGNARLFTTTYVDAEPMIAYGGKSPVFAEYDIEFPIAGDYAISLCFAAQSSRPVALFLDGKRLSDCCRGATGSWNTSKARWEEAARVSLSQGKHTLKIERPGSFPHVVALKFESSQPLPSGWKPLRPKAHTLESLARATGADSGTPVKLHEVTPAAVRLAIEDLAGSFGARYPSGAAYLRRLEAIEAKLRTSPSQQCRDELVQLQREALLANPLLNFHKLLLVKRGVKSPSLGLPYNWQSNSCLPKTGFDDEIAVLAPVAPEGTLATLYKPAGGRFVGDVDLHFDADRMLFSMPGTNGRWQVFEIRSDGSGLRQLTGQQPDVDSYDACYLPDGRILFTSTACFVGVPCVYGSSHVATLYRMDADGRHIRQLCFDQEHDWCPTLLNNGRILYTRWEYIDTPHAHTRLLFHMNPDGTEQMEYLGSNSYWPNSFFYARPIPNHPTRVIAVIGGHHDNPRMGELVLFDPALGRHEAAGAVQRIPGRGQKIEPLVRDGLTLASWPKFLHPFPLSDKYFLVACKPTPQSLWGIYLADVFDNLLLIKELPGYALLEPLPLRRTPRPPVIPDKVDMARNDAVVYLPDIYVGDGLKGIPRGTVKQLRILTYNFAYHGMGGLVGVVGVDGPWDIKRVLGTVPVYPDGSAKFRIPANTPVALQPLDAEGKALQLMRSWMTAMPGEVVQCAGCHEKQNTAPPARTSLARGREPDVIRPWHGPTRGFSYAREVQPVIDRYCVGCHNGQPRPDGPALSDLRGTRKITDWQKWAAPSSAGRFSVGYAELHRFVRRPGIESDYHLLTPMEFHADTTELVQILNGGHHNVKLDAEAWDRLVTWIDLNCPYHGTWGEDIAKPGVQRQRRRDLLKLYAQVDDDPEAVPQTKHQNTAPVMPEPLRQIGPRSIECPGWPFDAAEARRRQAAAGPVTRRKIDLGHGVSLEMVLIPAGEYVMGSTAGGVDEQPLHRVRIEKPFWMATREVTNQMYNLFYPAHDSGVEDRNGYQFGLRGFPCHQPEQPVVRVSWNEAVAFCRRLSQRTGQKFALPTEAEWEYACRAGTATTMFYGGLDADFSKFANLADSKLTEFASYPYDSRHTPLEKPSRYDDWIPKDPRCNDGALLAVEPGRYQPNAWGLRDMHGNVAEWTRSAYRPYPCRPDDGRNAATAEGRKVVRGGSWRDRPYRATSSFRLGYEPFQKVYNVGFRVVCE